MHVPPPPETRPATPREPASGRAGFNYASRIDNDNIRYRVGAPFMPLGIAGGPGMTTNSSGRATRTDVRATWQTGGRDGDRNMSRRASAHRVRTWRPGWQRRSLPGVAAAVGAMSPCAHARRPALRSASRGASDGPRPASSSLSTSSPLKLKNFALPCMRAGSDPAAAVGAVRPGGCKADVPRAPSPDNVYVDTAAHGANACVDTSSRSRAMCRAGIRVPRDAHRCAPGMPLSCRGGGRRSAALNPAAYAFREQSVLSGWLLNLQTASDFGRRWLLDSGTRSSRNPAANSTWR